MKHSTRLTARELARPTVLTVAIMTWSQAALASDAQLALHEYRWEKPVVSYWIKATKDISVEAVADVLVAFDDWNNALETVAEEAPQAPVLEMAASANKVDILVDLKIQATGPGPNRFGGPRPLRGGTGVRTTGCKLTKATLEISGQELGEPVQDARIRNLTRHLIGHALGLDDIVCPPGPADCTGDLMQWMHVRDAIPEVDLEISACDLEGIVAIYTAPGCGQIPDAIPYACE
jgi:hypothetical protein